MATTELDIKTVLGSSGAKQSFPFYFMFLALADVGRGDSTNFRYWILVPYFVSLDGQVDTRA